MDNKIILNARNHVLLNDPQVAKTIHDVRGEQSGDAEVHAHVEKAIREAQERLLREAAGDGDGDLILPDDDDDDDINIPTYKDNDDDAETEVPTIDDDDEDNEVIDIPTEGGESAETNNSFTKSRPEDTDKITKEIASAIKSDKSKELGELTSRVGMTVGATRSDYLQVIDALYKECVNTRTHRDVFNLLTFLRFEGAIRNVSAAFAFLDIPNTDLSLVFSDLALNENTFINAEGIFYKSSFNNDSILSWPWMNLRPIKAAFDECPYCNLDLNTIAGGREIIKSNDVRASKKSEIATVAGKLKSIVSTNKINI